MSQKKPIVGDLVLCHVIGDKYAWHLNQIGMVVEEKSKLVTPKKIHGVKKKREGVKKRITKSQEYVIYLFQTKRREIATTEQFEAGDVEIISKAN